MATKYQLPGPAYDQILAIPRDFLRERGLRMVQIHPGTPLTEACALLDTDFEYLFIDSKNNVPAITSYGDSTPTHALDALTEYFGVTVTSEHDLPLVETAT